MTQNIPPSPDLPHTQTLGQPPTIPATPEPVQPSISPKHPKQGTMPDKIKYSHVLVIVFLVILLLAFRDNPVAVSIILSVISIFSIKNFEPLADRILDFVEKLLKVLGQPLIHLWRLIFARHPRIQAKSQSRGRGIVINISLVVSVIILITFWSSLITGAGTLYDHGCLANVLPLPDCSSGFGLTSLANGVQIGLIKDDTYGPFDSSALNGGEKQVEALIFAENKKACSEPHLTIALVTMLGRTVENPTSDAIVGLEDLRGAVLAQQKYNATHSATALCLVIASLGTLDTVNNALPQVIHQLAQLARTDSSFRGIVGFPYSQPLKDAIQMLKNYPTLAAIPVVSPSASADTLSNIPNVYRIVSPDGSQGKALAQFFCNDLVINSTSTSLAIFDDTANEYSDSLQASFVENLDCITLDKQINLAYTIGNATSISQAVDEAVQKGANYIFFPGYNSDLDTLELELRNKLRDNSGSISIIGGDGLYDISGIVHYAYTNVYSTIFASPLAPDSEFIQRYTGQHFPLPYLVNSISEHQLLPPHSILSYDATTAFTETLKHLTSSDITQDSFNEALSTISFDGISGRIQFQGNRVNTRHISDRLEGLVYITCTDLYHIVHLNAQYMTINSTGFVQEILPADNKRDLCL